MNDFDSKNVFVYKNNIYYTVWEKADSKYLGKSIYKMGIDGSGNHKINDKYYYSFYISDNMIYAKSYIEGRLEKMDLEGNATDVFSYVDRSVSFKQ